jgi:hypothetical protein
MAKYWSTVSRPSLVYRSGTAYWIRVSNVHFRRVGRIGRTYTKVLDLVQDVVVESEVTAGDAVDTGLLLDLPVGEAKALGLGEEVGLRDLAAPVCGVVSG